ncbi:MAG TPA: hypothetical protein VGL86_23080 [Polyangia bacterium]|jgi:hypothetical protein
MRLVLAAALFVAAHAAHAKSTLAFAEHGFSIEPPAGHDESVMQQVVTLGLPARDEFSPNVNVQVQPFKGTIEEYLTMSREQFKAGGVTLVTEKHDARTATIEYKGAMQGHPLHWYARAFLGKNGLVLATATALESQWGSVSGRLRQSVDSLKPIP